MMLNSILIPLNHKRHEIICFPSLENEKNLHADQDALFLLHESCLK